MNLDQAYAEAARRLHAAEALLVTAGAGMGVDSGLPDFRGPEGFWRAYPAIAKRGLTFAGAANPEWFDRDPAFAWAFYGHRLNLYRRTRPHTGFDRLVELAAKMPAGSFVFTSNVDGHFQKAGFAPERIVECHGSIHHWQCARPCNSAIWEAGDTAVPVDEESFQALPPFPPCPRCGRLARPNILMFGDARWLSDRTDRQTERYAAWLDDLERHGAKLVVLEFGAGTSIPTVRMESEHVAQRLGGKLIRVNLREPDAPSKHLGLAAGAAAAIERLATAAPRTA